MRTALRLSAWLLLTVAGLYAVGVLLFAGLAWALWRAVR
jgi:hypothetical protein